MDIKVFEALCKSCRKMGIKKFKSAEYEFELGDEPVRQKKSNPAHEVVESSDELTPEQLLFYSTSIESLEALRNENQ
jgi:hypothetical protein